MNEDVATKINDAFKASERNRPDSRVTRLVLRTGFFFTHIWLAITHSWDIKEGKQFFRDERAGRYGRLKRAAIKNRFPNMEA